MNPGSGTLSYTHVCTDAQLLTSKRGRVNQKQCSFSGSYSIVVPRQFLTFQQSHIKLFPQVIISRVINHTCA